MTKDQVLALVRAHALGDDERFRTTVLQMQAHAEAQRRFEFAAQLKSHMRIERPTLLGGQHEDVWEGLLPSGGFDSLVLAKGALASLRGVVGQWAAREALEAAGVGACRRLLFTGPPGTGKTSAARALATELKQQFFRARLDGLVKGFLGDTGRALVRAFAAVRVQTGVFLFDEFDALGSARERATGETDVAEMRRATNQVLQLMDEPNQAGLVICATNMRGLLDPAVLRRFDAVIEFAAPTEAEKEEVARRVVERAKPTLGFGLGVDVTGCASHAEAERAAVQAVRAAIVTIRRPS